MSDIFISYARSTAAHAQKVAEALRAAGYSVWRDDDLPAHRAYGEVIEEQLGLAKAVVVVWSAEAVKSQWVRSEADRARGEAKLVQLAVDDVRLPMPFDQIQCADLSGWTGEAGHSGWIKTFASISALAGLPAQAQMGAPESNALSAGNLPRRQGALVGRQAELDQIGALLESADLVTVTGTGGVGKTRIAVEFAFTRQGRHEDGVWLVELAPLTDGDQVAGAIARALGVDLPPGRDPVDSLIARLRPRDCLIVLDNCEHVIDAVAAVAEAVLEQAPGVKLLASSQELIGVDGERVFRLRSLGEADAATLFADRARAADAGFELRPSDEAAITAICQRLDGIPLAIEMAAARAPALGCEGVLQRLDDRFRILTGGRRTALPRQRTLQATLDWSHGLLSPADAAVFRRLGVFTGGFTLDAASKVAADEALDELQVIDAVTSLLAKSLLAADREDGRTRYRLLETTRMYALEQLAQTGETLAIQRRHAQYFVGFSSVCRTHYYSVSDDDFHACYAPDMANIERAMDWAFGLDGEAELGIALAAQSWPAWVALSMGARWLAWGELARTRVGPETPPPMPLMLTRALLSAYCGNLPNRAMTFADECLDELRAQGDPMILGDAFNSIANALLLLGRTDEGKALVAEFTALVAPLPPSRLTLACRYRVAALLMQEDSEGAALQFRAAAELADSIGASGWANLMLTDSLGDLDVDDVEARIIELRGLLQRIRPTHMFSSATTASATYLLAYMLAARSALGDLEEAYGLVRGMEKIVGRTLPGRSLGILSIMAVSDGRPADSARLFGVLKSVNAQSGVNFAGSQRGRERILDVLADHLTPGEIETFADEGARLTPDQAYVLAMNLA